MMGRKITKIGKPEDHLKPSPGIFLLGLLGGALLALPAAYMLIQQCAPAFLVHVKTLISFHPDPAEDLRRLRGQLQQQQSRLDQRIEVLQRAAGMLEQTIQEYTMKQARSAAFLNLGKSRYRAAVQEGRQGPVYFAGETYRRLEDFKGRLEALYLERNSLATRLNELWENKERLALERQTLERWQKRAAVILGTLGAPARPDRIDPPTAELEEILAGMQRLDVEVVARETPGGKAVEPLSGRDGNKPPGNVESFLQQPGPAGYIDWLNYWIYALGEAPPVPNSNGARSPAQVQQLALKVAANRLQETLYSIGVNAVATVGQLVENNAAVGARLSHLNIAAQVVEQWYGEDGSALVLVRLYLLGPNGLGTILAPLELRRLAGLEPNHPWPRLGPLPARYTGLVVDARGLKANPALFTRIVTRSGRVVYDLAVMDPNLLVERGLCAYGQSLAELQETAHLGSNPLVVRAAETAGTFQADLLLENETGEEVVAADVQGGFLQAARVGILLD